MFNRREKILGFVVLALALFLFLDFGYFAANWQYDLLGPGRVNFGNPAAAPARPQGRPYFLDIPSLGVQAPVIYATATDENVFQALLDNGVVHYPGTANPGEVGNVYIFGHSSDYIWNHGRYKTVFAVLPDIQTGAVIYLSDAGGNIYSYYVTKTSVVSANDGSVLSQNTKGQKILTLQTSWPLGTALQRFIVRAVMR